MSGSQRKFNPFDSNWKDFEKNFMRGYRDAFNYDLSWLDGYIQNMISQAIPSSQHFSGFTQNRLRPDVFETHQDMIVRVRIPERANTRKLGVAFNNANKVRIYPGSGIGMRRFHSLRPADTTEARHFLKMEFWKFAFRRN